MNLEGPHHCTVHPCMPVVHELTQGSPSLKDHFTSVRRLTETLTDKLSDADASVQAMPDASPAKWHLAHTTWFFETFVLKAFVKGYRSYDSRFHFLFNSYYEAEGLRLERASRGILTRPSLDEILVYRDYVTKWLLQSWKHLPRTAYDVIELGCHREQQHQELLLTDIQFLFSLNPLAPALWQVDTDFNSSAPNWTSALPLSWKVGRSGLVEIGHGCDSFSFDAETPRHKVWLKPYALANRLVTNREWLEFIRDGGYRKPQFWLADGWKWIEEQRIEGPLYWRIAPDAWPSQFGLAGMSELDPAAPVRHVSHFEADAFARWAGARLPSEAEWEAVAREHDPARGNFLDRAGPVFPKRACSSPGITQLFGDLWEWTCSAFLPYPGFRSAAGALGEYNGKFMSGQFVLRGGSCATPRGHTRATYRNFFYPHQRWQFSGVRLAKDM